MQRVFIAVSSVDLPLHFIVIASSWAIQCVYYFNNSSFFCFSSIVNSLEWTVFFIYELNNSQSNLFMNREKLFFECTYEMLSFQLHLGLVMPTWQTQ